MWAVSVAHYENFPVASWLCPARLRPPIRAIYHFARTADDLADEGPATPAARLAALHAYRADLHRVAAGQAPSPRWASVFDTLARAMDQHALPLAPLDALLDAFTADADHQGYADRAALLAYCRQSAMPIGRLLLHLHGIDDGPALAQSDAVCSALQLINFWQDLSGDLPRGRCNLPRDDLRRHGLTPAQALAAPESAAARALVAELCAWAGQLMDQGAPLAKRLPGRIGWELRTIIAGGRCILAKISRMNFTSFARRPVLGWADGPALVWHTLCASHPAAHPEARA